MIYTGNGNRYSITWKASWESGLGVSIVCFFLIGVRELGKGKMNFTKEQKQDLIHIAICKLMSLSGYYTLEGLDEDGWPHWKLVKKLPHVDMLDQEKLLKMHIIEYFDNEIGW